MFVSKCAALVLAVSFPAGAQTIPAAAVKPQAQVSRPIEWRDYAGSPEGHRYVPLTQITKDNVTKLAVAWSYPHAETGVNPIVAHGVIYTKARNKSIVAIDAATGKELWVHAGLTAMTERGMNYWESKDGRDRRLIFALADYLQEIDASTGKLIRTFGKNGAVDLRDELRRDPNFMRVQSGTPGKVFEDLILLGSATGEGYFSTPGDVRAYNVMTGKLAWQFHTVPHPGEPGYDTWPKEAWRYIGGVNTWGEISIDSVRGIAYFPLGSPTYDYYGADRIGKGLYGNCILALDAHTGNLLWYFQTIHHDIWDYDNAAAPMLTTIEKDGKKIDIVAMASKGGYLYVFNRVTGEPIWPIPETPVPQETDIPGEVVWPTQPIPTIPPPFVSHSFTVKDINPYLLTERQRTALIDQIKASRDQGVFTPNSFEPVIHMPGPQGGANWGMTSANPINGSVYVLAFNFPGINKLAPPRQGRPQGGGRGGAQGPGAGLYTANCASCHGVDRTGESGMPTLVGVAARLNAAQIRTMIVEGRAPMPGFRQLAAADIDALVTFVSTADAGGRGGGRGGPALTFPPTTIVETGPAATRPDMGGRTGGMVEYPDGAVVPENRLTTGNVGGGDMQMRGKPPYTSLTAYDLNKGAIRWQIGLGDDYRVVKEVGVHGTGAAEPMKSSVIVTAAGLIFANAADRKIHIYDADNGKELHQIPMGAVTSGSPSMFELNGRQYLLVTASAVGTRQGGDDRAADPNQTGPSGLVAISLKQ
jgi:quinoprotein glucose dehydrogenase